MLLATFGVVAVLAAPAVYAADNYQTPQEACDASGGAMLNGSDTVCCPTAQVSDSATACLFSKYVNPVIATLSVMVGIAVVIGIVVGGIQYASSAGDPQRAAKGKSTITKAITGLVAFMFLYSALQFLSPGGMNATPDQTALNNGATIVEACSNNFLGLKPWFAYLPASAFDAGTCNVDNFTLLGANSDLGRVVLALADDLVRIAALVAVAFVVVGGIQFVTSQGDPERAKKARQTILNAVIGVIVAIIAAALVSFIGNSLSS